MLRQGGGGSVLGEGKEEEEEEEDSPKMSAVSSAWGKSHQMLVWGKCQSTCLTFCGPETCFLALDSPKGTSCQQLLFCISNFHFISQILHQTVPSCHILGKKMIYYNAFVFPAFVFVFLLPGLSSLSGLP